MAADAHGSAIDAAIDVVTRLRAALKKGANRQVRSSDDRNAAKAAVHAWFKLHRLAADGDPAELQEVDASFARIMEWAERNTSRDSYLVELAALKERLVRIRSNVLVRPTRQPVQTSVPDFKPLIADPKMIAILVRRWDETWSCLQAGAYLASTVMMGGLLEALFLARINALQAMPGGMAPAFKAAAAPKDQAGKTKPLKEWGLKDYIDVAHELKWIAASAKDVSVVLRDYRNYIHPQKELSHGIVVDKRETDILSSVFVTVTNQILASV